ncbi:hypothetical protein TWF718_010293 [Orbilia javanica]|uniref:Uncharacterized protein n=1 Tax=Orbilia javanica TaxID=47235 RepID=A0AAN8MXN1_9PEZI
MIRKGIQRLLQKVEGVKEKIKGKDNKAKGHVYSSRIMVIAPMTLALALPEMSPEGAISEVLAPPQPVIVKDEIFSTAQGSSHSVAPYDQEDLAAIDGVIRPAFPRSLSAEMIHEERSQLERHLRHERLSQRGVKLTTTILGKKRSTALAAWESLEERAQKEAKTDLPVMPKTSEGAERESWAKRREFGSFKTTIPTKPVPVRDEEFCDERWDKPVQERIVIKTSFRLRRRLNSKVASITQPTQAPIRRGFRFWLRDGVDPTVDTSYPHLYGQDRPGMKKTVHPRPWDTVLVTSVRPPRVVPREVYREFTRAAWYYFPRGFKDNDEEYAAYQQWLDAKKETQP